MVRVILVVQNRGHDTESITGLRYIIKSVASFLNIYLSTCNIYVNQPDTQCFMIEFIHNIWWLDMFRNSMVHPQERLQAAPNGKCCEGYIVPSMVRLIYQLKSVLK